MSFGATSMTSETSMTGTYQPCGTKKLEKTHIFFLKKIYVCIYIYILWTKMENISIDIHRIWKTSVGRRFTRPNGDDVSAGLRLRAVASLD